ncbi:unnamed protein product [Allacma fusca]|uniref:Cytochrome P450 n=1 Tax=Allacma fusca TaxID=39272 RepID=A0A8J2P6E6_9HEXA|nr:unnamed protein product [Allacma fusca]
MGKKAATFTLFRGMKALLFLIFPKLAKGLGLSLTDPESLDFFTKLIETNIQKRREPGAQKRHDFLEMMLEAQAGQSKVDEKELDTFEKDAILDNGSTVGKRELSVVLDDTTVAAQALLFFFAGFDTIESLLLFSAYELALNPDVQEKLAQEVVPVMQENKGDLTYEATQKLEYLDMFVSETLRFHPPAFATERKCTQEYKVPDSDVVLPIGTQVLIPINGIHHDEKYYPEPEKFNPEHFSAENKAKRHPYAFLPFGQGPRNCIAMRFALTEAKAAIAHLVYNFKVEPSEKTQIPVKLSNKTTIKKPVDGMWLSFQSRDTSLY